MTQANAGRSLSPEQESDLRHEQQQTELAEAEDAVEVIERKIAGMQATLRDRKAEVKRLRAELKGGRD